MLTPSFGMSIRPAIAAERGASAPQQQLRGSFMVRCGPQRMPSMLPPRRGPRVSAAVSDQDQVAEHPIAEHERVAGDEYPVFYQRAKDCEAEGCSHLAGIAILRCLH